MIYHGMHVHVPPKYNLWLFLFSVRFSLLPPNSFCAEHYYEYFKC